MVIKKYLFFTLIVLVVAFAGAAAFFYWQFEIIKQNPRSVAQTEVKDLIARVSKLIVLPKDEEPTIATVSDPIKLQDQPFFVKAKAGDKVLIYPNSKKAILYDPTNNIILEVAPVNLGQ